MKSFLLFVTILFVLVLINNTDGQGSPAASIGAYITRYREKQKHKALREKRRGNKGPSERQRDRVRYNGFYYNEPSRYYYT